MKKALLNISGVFYAVLCIFSIVTGLMYAFGKRELNPVELPDSFMKKMTDPSARKRFARKMGWVTFAVGIAQGIASFSFFKRKKKVFYWIALGFTAFSLFSVGFKIVRKFSVFAFSKTIAYISILAVLLQRGTGKQFE